MEPSIYQKGIYDWASKESGNAVVQAVAGSGKTTTLVNLSRRLKGELLFLAFNKAIAKQLETEMFGVEVRTMHSLGYSMMRKKKLDINKNKNYIVDLFPSFSKARKHIRPTCQLVSLCKAQGKLNYDPHDLANEYELEIDWDVFKKVWKFNQDLTQPMDFDDMIWRPAMFSTDIVKRDWVMIDECQDLNPVMLDLLSLVDGRKIFVGDTAQAIYGFRGADKRAMNSIKAKFDCTELPLSVCYRCGSEIVKQARKFSRDIEWHWEGGSVSHGPLEPKAGDLVVCRVTSELVVECLKLFKRGIKCVILGKEIGEGLLRTYTQAKSDVHYYKKCKTRAQQIIFDDQMDVLRALEVYSPGKIKKTIKQVFGSTKKGVTFSTIHKAKGLEADRVFILRPDLLPHPKATDLVQEQNLEYVAITRAKKELIYVS